VGDGQAKTIRLLKDIDYPAGIAINRQNRHL
jgi:hypothetical protein